MDLFLIKNNDTEVLMSWHEWLDKNRGDRAKLRRAKSAEDIMMQSAFQRFLSHQSKTGEQNKPTVKCLHKRWRQPENWLTAAMVCGLLAKVKTLSTETHKTANVNQQEGGIDKKNTAVSFSAALAMPAGTGDRPRMSETRFVRLQKSNDEEEFYLQMSRAIDLLGGTVPAESMVEDILHWHREYIHGVDKNPTKRMVVRWATDYYTTIK